MKQTTRFATLLTAMVFPIIAEAETVEITVENIETQTGTLRIGLYDEDTYRGGDAINGANVTIVGDTVSVTLEGVEPGEYGVKIFHDEDDDGQLDTNPFGIPTEAFAFSNNAKGRFGPASWDDAKFAVTEAGTRQVISLN